MRDSEDMKLTYQAAMQRTSQVLWHGEGLQIPFYSLYRYWKCYTACQEGGTLEWEYESVLILKDEKPWRIGVYGAVRLAFLGILMVAMMVPQIPRNRGDITAAEFCENYRALESFYDMNGKYYLNDEGVWEELPDPAGVVTIYFGDEMFGFREKQDFHFVTDSEGNVQEIGFTLKVNQNPEEGTQKTWMPDCQDQMQLAVLAFVGARKEFRSFSSERTDLMQLMEAHAFEDFEFTKAGVEVECDVEYQGYIVTTAGYLIPEEDGESSFLLKFVMRRAGGFHCPASSAVKIHHLLFI